MHPEDIKAELKKRGWTQAALADEIGVSRSAVAQTIGGGMRSARVQGRIALLIGQPVASIWPDRVGSLRRTRAQIDAQRRAAA